MQGIKEMCPACNNTILIDWAYGSQHSLRCRGCGYTRIEQQVELPPEDEPTPCAYGDHDWTETLGGECSYCRQCGAYDC